MHKENLKYLLVTFDYELFLGERSGTVEDCMIIPTSKILVTLRQHNIKHGIFFVDTTYLARLKRENSVKTDSDFKKISSQLVQILKEGHYIFPHLHPHWLDAKYDAASNTWTLTDLTRFRFHNISMHDRSIIFEDSVSLIRSIQDQAGISYPIDSFRAGGWGIQPFVDFREPFVTHSIQYDFSVLPGHATLSDDIYFDFRGVKEVHPYKFNTEITEKDDHGRFTEFPISVLYVPKNRTLFQKIIDKILWWTTSDRTGKGKSVERNGAESVNPLPANGNLKPEKTAIELLTLATLPYYKNYVNNSEHIHFISHPKMISSHNLAMFSRLMRFIKNRYEVETDYKKIAAAYESL